ncbi:hypothetical protein ACFS32_00320 [Novosphingobium pokkalii]|uniref:hypothetical protein n=1 Tax=Novosphingobium pokkalii TaxID=1770194 RepID=UPI00363D6F4B
MQHGHGLAARLLLAQHQPDFGEEFAGRCRVGQFLPVDHAIDVVEAGAGGRERQQDAAIENRAPALVGEFRLEADRRLVGDDLHVVIGDARQDRAAGHLAQPRQRTVVVAIGQQRTADIGDGRVFQPGIEMQQHRMIGKIGQVPVEQRADQRQTAFAQHAGPEIVGAHLHAALVRIHQRRQRLIVEIAFRPIVFESPPGNRPGGPGSSANPRMLSITKALRHAPCGPS